jgi:hypothetical protein
MLPMQRVLNNMGQWRTTVKREKGPNAYCLMPLVPTEERSFAVCIYG